MDFKELARLILQGWCAANNTAEDERQNYEDYYRPLVEHEADAHLLALFGHWSNDLLSIFGTAPHIRLCIEVSDDGKWTVRDVPDPVIADGRKLEDYYWSCGGYKWDGDKMVWETGSWQLGLEEVSHEA